MEDPSIVSRAWAREYIKVVISHTLIMLLTLLSMLAAEMKVMQW